MRRVHAETARDHGGGHEQDQQRAHAVIAETFPELREEQRAQTARVAEESVVLCGLIRLHDVDCDLIRIIGPWRLTALSLHTGLPVWAPSTFVQLHWRHAGASRSPAAIMRSTYGQIHCVRESTTLVRAAAKSREALPRPPRALSCRDEHRPLRKRPQQQQP